MSNNITAGEDKIPVICMHQNYSTTEPFERESYNQRHVHPRDGALAFDPETHIYTHTETNQPLTSVTSFIGSFFDEYNPYYWIEKDDNLTFAEKQVKMTEQDRKGYVARNLGTFLHTQIENFFLGREVEKRLTLIEETYDHGDHSIAKEIEYFQDFVMQHRLNPYRTEWMIYDDEYWLAGTLDLLVQEENGTYTMYDWKRSRRMGREYGSIFYPNTRNVHQSGHGVLSHLADTPFIHAVLQQNLYRHILAKCYDIEVSKMYLVVLSPSFRQAHQVEVPFMKAEVEQMLKSSGSLKPDPEF